jgi:hypothetical protein
VLRRVLRHPWSVKAFRTLHPDLASRLALGSSHTSRAMRPGDGGKGLRAVAAETLKQDRALEVLIYGHSHVRALERVAGGGIYANPGAWLQEPTYLRIDEDRVELLRWNVSTSEGERLDMLERRAQEVRGDARELLGGVGDDVSALGRPFA